MIAKKSCLRRTFEVQKALDFVLVLDAALVAVAVSDSGLAGESALERASELVALVRVWIPEATSAAGIRADAKMADADILARASTQDRRV